MYIFASIAKIEPPAKEGHAVKREDAIQESKRINEEKLRVLREVANRRAGGQEEGARATR